jgi:ribosomal protein S18 acetylase RimI-like enzyme
MKYPIGTTRRFGEDGPMELFILPAGPADAEQVARVQRLSWQAAYARQLSPMSLARAEAAWGAAHWREVLERVDSRSFTLVLSNARGVAGFGMAGRRRGRPGGPLAAYDSEIYMLYLLPRFQGQGHGGRLMTALASTLKARGAKSTLVWALASNRPAIDFYQHLGGAVLTDRVQPFFGDTVNETALVWPDIDILAAMPRDARK